jgi:hypothetical protein
MYPLSSSSFVLTWAVWLTFVGAVTFISVLTLDINSMRVGCVCFAQRTAVGAGLAVDTGLLQPLPSHQSVVWSPTSPPPLPRVLCSKSFCEVLIAASTSSSCVTGESCCCMCTCMCIKWKPCCCVAESNLLKGCSLWREVLLCCYH